MKKFPLKRGLIFLLAIILGGLLFKTSEKVQDAERDLRQIRAEIKSEKGTIEVLETEWEYLNRPQRLEELAKSKLGMNTPGDGDVVDTVKDVPGVTVKGFETLGVPQPKPLNTRRTQEGI